jgi:hypothetical protein
MTSDKQEMYIFAKIKDFADEIAEHAIRDQLFTPDDSDGIFTIDDDGLFSLTYFLRKKFANQTVKICVLPEAKEKNDEAK